MLALFAPLHPQPCEKITTASYLEWGVSTEKEESLALGVENQSALGNISQVNWCSEKKHDFTSI